MGNKLYKLTVFIPQTHLDIVKSALFEAGAGRYQNYDCCSFDLAGKGQFRALDGANPHIGSLDKVEYVDEIRSEMIVKHEDAKNVLEALNSSHPYEEPAFDFIELVDVSSWS